MVPHRLNPIEKILIFNSSWEIPLSWFLDFLITQGDFFFLTRCVLAIAAYFLCLLPEIGCTVGAAVLHESLLFGVLRAPLKFFDCTPVGRILSRFAKDVDVLDEDLLVEVPDCLYQVFEVIINQCSVMDAFLLFFGFEIFLLLFLTAALF